MVVYVGRISVLGTLAFVVSMVGATAASSANSLEFKTRRQVPVAQGASQHHSVFETATWDPKQTAIVICDMWDQHWCQGATTDCEVLRIPPEGAGRAIAIAPDLANVLDQLAATRRRRIERVLRRSGRGADPTSAESRKS